MEGDSLAALAEEMRASEQRAGAADWTGLAREYGAWAARLDALRKRLLDHMENCDGGICPFIEAIAGETEKGGTE